MAEISKRYTISYRWNNDLESISPEHQAALDETAEGRIAEMLKEGYTSGELHDIINMLHTDPEDGIEYRGSWDLNIVVVGIKGQPKRNTFHFLRASHD